VISPAGIDHPLDTGQHRAAASALAAAERERSPIAPLSESWPEIDAGDGYRIQLLNVRERTQAGAIVKGHKVGLTSLAMQRQLGVSEPDYGHLLDDMFVFEDDCIVAGDLCAPRVEPEVGFVLDRPLQGPGVTAADVLRATAYVVPALEVIDSRIADWRITLPDTIADNASSARVVLGASPTLPTDVDLKLVPAVLRKCGQIVETGTSAAVLGNPVTAVAWLANKLAELGSGLEAGHVVLPGSCTAAVAVRAGEDIRADFGVLGSVGVRFS
jgi:2-keto-4-pentenoate hydratase